MKNELVSPKSWCGFGLAAVLSVGATLPTEAALDFLKRDNEKPSASEQASNEGAANGLLAEAQSRESAGDYGKAEKIYESIVKHYPRSTAAAESQFKIAELKQVDGKEKKAFEEFQKFLTDYKGSPRFAEAVQRQFTIAESLRVHGSKGFLGGIGADVQPSKLIEFYEQISTNAPRTEISAQSRLAVGTIHASQGDLEEAIVAFESVVEDYPGTKYAAEAQFNLVKLHGQEANKSFSPVDMRQQREAGEDFINQFGDDPRSQEVRQALGGLSDKEAQKAFDVAKFYERNGNLKSAAIYYREVAQHPETKHYQDAQNRLAKLIEKDPSLASVANAPAPVRDSDAGAALSPIAPPPAELPTQPSPPTVARPSAPEPPTMPAPPKMRTSDDDVLPIPTDDPVAGN
ncbi:MAG: tetratricopeptide repeat protein [Verrucomicrobiae bacterium]|nr:tetratricopeptide repeat protein [Verrucomicrobiae bacterium]